MNNRSLKDDIVTMNHAFGSDEPWRMENGHFPRQELIERFAELMDKVSTGVGPTMHEAWSEIELTIDQFRALALLRQGPQRITDIASTLGIRLSAATTFIDRLETKRLIERFHDQEDRRVVRCRLTALGVKEAQSLWRINRQRVEHLATILSRDELEKVLEVLAVLAAAIEQQTKLQEALKSRGIEQR